MLFSNSGNPPRASRNFSASPAKQSQRRYSDHSQFPEYIFPSSFLPVTIRLVYIIYEPCFSALIHLLYYLSRRRWMVLVYSLFFFRPIVTPVLAIYAYNPSTQSCFFVFYFFFQFWLTWLVSFGCRRLHRKFISAFDLAGLPLFFINVAGNFSICRQIEI